MNEYADYVLLIARLVLGVVMIYYGWPKVKDLKKNASDFVEMGFKPGLLWGTIVAFVELLGGIAIIIGVYVDVGAALMGIQMIVGTIWKLGFTDKKFSDWSYDLLVLGLALVLLAFGAGSFVLI